MSLTEQEAAFVPSIDATAQLLLDYLPLEQTLTEGVFRVRSWSNVIIVYFMQQRMRFQS